MKNNGKFITLIVSLLLVSTALLSGCMEGLTVLNPKEKTFDSSDGVDMDALLQGGNLAAQAEMQEKFSEYSKTETDGDGRTTLTLFPDGQVDELLAKRENGESGLSYEEILFLINDSVQLYNKFDCIILPEARRLNLTPIDEFSMSGYVINTERVDESELSYQGYNKMMQKIREEIYTIILYRIYILDARLTRYYERYDAAMSAYRYNGQIGFEPFTGEFPYRPVGHPEVKKAMGYALILGEIGGSFPGMIITEEAEDYPGFLKNCLLESRFIPYAYSMNTIVALPDDTILIDLNESTITMSTGETQTKLYAGEDVWKLNEHYFDTDTVTIGMSLYPNGTYFKGPTLKGEDVGRLLETLDPPSVVRSQELLSKVFPGEYFAYYVVDFQNGTSILLPVDDDSGIAAVTPDSAYDTNQIFKECVPKAFSALVKEYYAPFLINHDPGSYSVYPMILRERLMEVTLKMYTDYDRTLNQFVMAASREEELLKSLNPYEILKSPGHDLLKIPEFAELEELILSDQRYAYLVLRYALDAESSIWSHCAMAALIKNNDNFAKMVVEGEYFRVIAETALSDPDKYLPY